MRLKLLALAATAILAFGISGCPALMIGSLGYSGYEYEKTGKLPGMPSTPSGASGANKSNPQATLNPNDIE